MLHRVADRPVASNVPLSRAGRPGRARACRAIRHCRHGQSAGVRAGHSGVDWTHGALPDPTTSTVDRVRIPRDAVDDYSRSMAAQRRQMLAESPRCRPGPRRALQLGPAGAARQHRELRRRGAGADRRGRTAGGQRRARPWRVPDSDGHHGGHARGQLRPRHAPVDRVRRGHHDGRRRVHAARPGIPVRQRPRGPRLRPVGDRQLRGDQGGGGGDDADRPARVHRPVPGRPAAVSAVQLHDRRRRRAEHDRQGDPGGVRVDQCATVPVARSTCCPATSTPTRSTPTSTRC